jgi:hypothetical protein
MFLDEISPALQLAPPRHDWNVSVCAKFPRKPALLPHRGLADAITPEHSVRANAAGLLRSDGGPMGTDDAFAEFGPTEYP